MNAPKFLWAWSWDKWNDCGGYARPTNRHPLDQRERDSGAEYTRADLTPSLEQLITFYQDWENAIFFAERAIGVEWNTERLEELRDLIAKLEAAE